MTKLHPFEVLEKDYYMGEEATGGGGRESDEELSSDDELQRELCKLAGIRKDDVPKQRKEKQNRSQFEMDMECELDQLITDYANEHLSGNVKRPAVPTISCQEYLKICEEDEMPPLVDNDDNIGNDAKDSSKDGTRDWEAFIPLKQPKLEFKQPSEKLTTIEEMETDVVIPESDTLNPSTSTTSEKAVADELKLKDAKAKIGLSGKSDTQGDEDDNPIKRSAKQTMNDVGSEAAEFYDPDEDDENEIWMQTQRSRSTGMESKSAGKETRPRIDGNSDAVLSCPGCMVLLTRDCQRHEIYSDQYRAMFVENCHVKQESLKIEKTGKEKRRERQKMRKIGVDPNEQPVQAEDIFLPVQCAVCSTNVAVLDHEEVYHFFNVLTGYA